MRFFIFYIDRKTLLLSAVAVVLNLAVWGATYFRYNGVVEPVPILSVITGLNILLSFLVPKFSSLILLFTIGLHFLSFGLLFALVVFLRI